MWRHIIESLDKIMVFNFSLTQKLSPFFFIARRAALFLAFFLPHRISYFGRVQETVGVQIAAPTNYILIFSHKRKNRTCSFLQHGWDTSLDSKSENKYRLDLFSETHEPAFFVCNHTSASGNFICLTSHDKIIAESFQFDWEEKIFYKTEQYIQSDCKTTN